MNGFFFLNATTIIHFTIKASHMPTYVMNTLGTQ